MKYVFILVFNLSLFSISYAEEPSEVSLLISKIKTAEASDRRLLINQLKMQLREANKETKAKAMAELRKSFRNSNDGTKIKNVHRKNSKHNTVQHKQMQNFKPKMQQNGQQQKGKR